MAYIFNTHMLILIELVLQQPTQGASAPGLHLDKILGLTLSRMLSQNAT